MYYILSARNGKDHFVDERIDWYSQITLCGKNTRGMCTDNKYEDKAVECKKCMTKAGFIKKSHSTNSKSEPGIIGYNQTIYTVIKSFSYGNKDYQVGDLIDGDRYNHAADRQWKTN